MSGSYDISAEAIGEKFDIDKGIINAKSAMSLGAEFIAKLNDCFNTGLGVEYQFDREAKVKSDTDGEYSLSPKFHAIPLYLTAEYNLPIYKTLNPFIKTNLGWNVVYAGNTDANIGGLPKTAYTGGLYYALGGGMYIYKNLKLELMYAMCSGTRKVDLMGYDEEHNIIPITLTSNDSYSKLGISLGYAFDLGSK
jgi:hypothetical protein